MMMMMMMMMMLMMMMPMMMMPMLLMIIIIIVIVLVLVLALALAPVPVLVLILVLVMIMMLMLAVPITVYSDDGGGGDGWRYSNYEAFSTLCRLGSQQMLQTSKCHTFVACPRTTAFSARAFQHLAGLAPFVSFEWMSYPTTKSGMACYCLPMQKGPKGGGGGAKRSPTKEKTTPCMSTPAC